MPRKLLQHSPDIDKEQPSAARSIGLIAQMLRLTSTAEQAPAYMHIHEPIYFSMLSKAQPFQQQELHQGTLHLLQSDASHGDRHCSFARRDLSALVSIAFDGW